MESRITRILLYGFGRMGLTHFAILNGIEHGLQFTILETNKKLVSLLKKNLPQVRFVTSSKELGTEPYDLTLITTPPFVHHALVAESLERGDRRVFVEKPFGGHSQVTAVPNADSNVYIGYVLRFNPCVQWVKEHIKPEEIVYAKGQYLSNTIEKKPKGWRNGAFSGVLNEMGSHIIDLLNFLVDLQGSRVVSAQTTSVVSDIDDIVDASLEDGRGRTIDLHFNWVAKDVRKPTFGLELGLKDGRTVTVDPQVIRIKQGDQEVERIAVTDLGAEVPYYLRGVDFTKQMEDLLGPAATLCTQEEALTVNRIINDILSV